MSRPEPVVNRRASRRGFLASGATLGLLAGLGAVGSLVSACGGGSTAARQPAVEDLHGPLDQARSDSALASAAAVAVGLAPQIAAALTVVATQRAAHATALATEIFRVAGKATSATAESTSPTSAPAGAPADPPPPPPTVADVVNALRASAESANRLAATASGFRAGLLGSIAASCTASYAVALVPGGPSI